LGVAVSFSPRTVFLAAAVGLLVLWARRDRRDWLVFTIMTALGGAAAIALNLAIAPLSGFLLWMVQFNSKLLPYTRAAWQASYGSIAVGIFAVTVSAVGFTALLVRRIARPTHARVTAAVDLMTAPGLLAAQAVMVACWAFLFVDHHWGRQSFGAIAVATSCYAAALIAHIFKAIEITPTQNRAPVLARVGLLPITLTIAISIGGGGALAYWSVDKIARIMSRLQPAGMLTDMATTLNEMSYRLENPNDLPPLGEAANLGEWLLWSRRYCELFRNERIVAVPTRHPVCARDATYYWYAGVHFRTMARECVAFVPNPPYNVAEDVLTAKPAFIENGFLSESVLPDPRIETMLKNEYLPVRSSLVGHWAWLRKDFMERQ
jgi:hypothetical protein